MLEGRLSSKATGFYRSLPYALPILIFASSSFLARGVPAESILLLLGFSVAIFLILYFSIGRLHEVSLEGDLLVISRRRVTIQLPLRDVESVGGSRFTNPEIVWLDLRRPSELGSRIRFMPPARWRLPWQFFDRSPLVEELSDRIRRLGAEE